MNSTYTQLVKNLEYLKMKQLVNHLDEIIDFTTKNNLSFVDALVKLTSCEIDFKETNMIKAMVKVGAFPHNKEIKDFDFEFQPNINRDQILDFISLRFIEAKENIVFLGSSGVGKTHHAHVVSINGNSYRLKDHLRQEDN